MDIKARKKKNIDTYAERSKKLSAQSVSLPEDTGFTHSIQMRCNTLLYNAMQNMISSAHTSGDYTFTSVADVIRASLQAYKDGMLLTEQVQMGEKMQTSIRVHQNLYQFNKQLPNRLKTSIHERSIRTFLKSL